MGETPREAEIELKFDADEGFALPDLRDLPGVADVPPPQVYDLEAVYYDTADYRLAANRHTLRRREGGHDAGWHLKRPRGDGFRDELQEPVGEPGAVPATLRRLVEVHTRGGELVPVVRLSTRRTATELRSAAGAVLAEIAQDDVTAELPAFDGRAAEVQRWSEVEAELVDGDLALLEAVRARLLAGGARLSGSPSKLARALGDRVPPAPAPELAPGSAGEALLAYLRDRVHDLQAQDPLVRVDAPDAVHQMRVGCRRLRAVLAAFRPVVVAEGGGAEGGGAEGSGPSEVEGLRAELRWLGEVLGAARDTEVVRDRLLASVAAEPSDLVLGPVGAFITETFSARYRAAHDAALDALGSSRYFALLDALDALVSSPPRGPRAGDPAAKVLRRQLRRTYRRVERHVDEARAAEGEHRGELFHEVRKSAKRARYAGDAASGVLAEEARRYAKAMKAVQEVLGNHQDGVVARRELRALAVAAHLDGQNAFTYGRLHGLEQAAGERALEQFDDLWREARRSRVK
jgi:CHAD domain-containing protein